MNVNVIGDETLRLVHVRSQRRASDGPVLQRVHEARLGAPVRPPALCHQGEENREARPRCFLSLSSLILSRISRLSLGATHSVPLTRCHSLGATHCDSTPRRMSPPSGHSCSGSAVLPPCRHPRPVARLIRMARRTPNRITSPCSTPRSAGRSPVASPSARRASGVSTRQGGGGVYVSTSIHIHNHIHIHTTFTFTFIKPLRHL